MPCGVLSAFHWVIYLVSLSNEVGSIITAFWEVKILSDLTKATLLAISRVWFKQKPSEARLWSYLCQ